MTVNSYLNPRTLGLVIILEIGTIRIRLSSVSPIVEKAISLGIAINAVGIAKIAGRT